MSQAAPDTSRHLVRCLSGLDISSVYRATEYYVIAYSADRTKQLLFSYDQGSEKEPDIEAFFDSVAQRVDQDLNPGPEWADKVAPGKAVEIYLLLPLEKSRGSIVTKFYTMLLNRVLFRISIQAHLSSGPPLVDLEKIKLSGAPNPRFSVGSIYLDLAKVTSYKPK